MNAWICCKDKLPPEFNDVVVLPCAGRPFIAHREYTVQRGNRWKYTDRAGYEGSTIFYLENCWIPIPSRTQIASNPSDQRADHGVRHNGS